jgi:hypothetical protein
VKVNSPTAGQPILNGLCALLICAPRVETSDVTIDTVALRSCFDGQGVICCNSAVSDIPV